MQRFATILLLSTLSTLSVADDLRKEAAVGGAIGGALGGLIGAELGGRDGAILGSGVGASVGTAISTGSQSKEGKHHHSRDYPRYERSSQPVKGPAHCPPGHAKKGWC